MSEFPEQVLQKIQEAQEKQLTKLSLSYNRLTNLPKSITKLTNLTELYLNGNQLTNLPESITKLTNLTELYLDKNQLTNLPESIDKLTNLTRLFLSDNQLTNLPESIGKLTNLTVLALDHNQLTNLPESITKLTNLTWLNLWHNQLINLPESIGKLTNLTRLFLSDNQLKNLPESIIKLTNLTRLFLSDNQLKNLPESIDKLTNLTELSLGNNQLTNLSESITKLTNLTELSLYSSQLKNLPESITKLTNLTELNLSGNQLTNLPESITQLTNLTKLNLGNNRLTNLPESITKLINLTEIILWHNQLKNLPESIAKLTNLTGLALNNNQLTNLPKSIAKLTNLTKLDLSCNQLTNLPEHITKLTNLLLLNLGSNQLTDLPESITKLTNLNLLNLSYNQIKKIPIWLAENKLKIDIESLENQLGIYIGNRYIYERWNRIILLHNPIEEPPLEVVKQGNQAILNYYSQIVIQGKDYLYEAKMLIVGEGGAGKTTLAHKIQDNNCPLPNIDDRTKGITINTHTFSVQDKNNQENRTFQLNVWDFGGQDIYHATHRFFLSKRSLYVLVADNRKDDTDFNYWLNIIELFAANSPIMIVLNEKDDLQRKINASELRSRYHESLKEILTINFKTYEETDNDKRQQRLKLIRQLISHIEHNAAHLPHIGEPVPALWVDIREAVENDSRNYISLKDFDEICHEQKLADDGDIKTLLGYFHDLGIVLHFADNPLLRDLVILKPAWVSNAVYRIFDNDVIKAKQGRFSRTDCSDLWSGEQYKYMHDLLIELMKNFLLVYEIDQTGNLIAPQMLSQDTPNYNWDDSNNSLMQFRYDLFMPKGILWQFIVTMYPYIENHSWVWRNGVILERDGTRAEIRENIADRRIYLRFSGASIVEFRAIIADQLDHISQSYHKLKYEKMVPCPCSICCSSSEPHFFKFSVLKKRQVTGKKQTIECEISEEDVPLNLLLEGFEPLHPTEELIESSTQEITQKVTNYYGPVGTVVEGEQNLRDVNWESFGTIDQSRNINISDNAQVTTSGANAFSQGDTQGTIANELNNQTQPSQKPKNKKILEISAAIATIIGAIVAIIALVL